MKSAHDIVGPWADPSFESGLIQRCKAAWRTPINELNDEMLATFLRQKIAVREVAKEAKRRIESNVFDGTEMFEGELRECLNDVVRSELEDK